MKTLEERIGQRIAQQRRAYGLTQAQLAEKADVFPETISRIETGHRTASLGLLVRVADAIEVELHELFRLRGSDSPKDVAMDRLLWFASRLSAPEIEHLLEIGAAVFASTRRGK
jgi:transcriptional regulator with XRE-family HTH domain